MTQRDGGDYIHRCSLESYKEALHFIDENRAAGVTTDMLWAAMPDVPCTQTSVAIAFLKERSCLETVHRRLVPSSPFFVEDALVEYLALEYQAAGGRG